MPSHNEERTGSIKDSGDFHYPEDIMRLKRFKLYLCDSRAFLRGVDGLE